MAHVKTNDGFTFSCDCCGDVWAPPHLGRGSASRTFTESWEDARRQGWRAIKNTKGEWESRCQSCA